ncbi:alpha/beta hydrolase [Glaciecola siphonariae]|uniref:Alpha/beta hydrolase n=1 Tax=Glaciecola siphonariae TaxID=521012 RepID=A0ABV9LUV5_9ALTE
MTWKPTLRKHAYRQALFTSALACTFLLCTGQSFAQANAATEARQPSRVITDALSKNAAALAKQMQVEQAFVEIYSPELGPLVPCMSEKRSTLAADVKVCSDKLRNQGNAPYALLSPDAKATVVLFHGLSDSPFFVSSIAQHLHTQGYNVIAPLTPGHGKLNADADMQDTKLQERWYEHADKIMALAASTHEKVFVGGFSTGGAFATRYTLLNPDEIDGLLLFSGALELSASAETMSKIWGIKTLAKWLDGEYQTDGPNPYKYPKVASYSGLVLMDVIKDIREILKSPQQEFELEKPIFVAHSMADTTTLFSGIEDLLSRVRGEHAQFKIDEEFDVCHADLVISATQVIEMKFDKSKVNASERCAVPKANPLHANMLSVLSYFLEQHSLNH